MFLRIIDFVILKFNFDNISNSIIKIFILPSSPKIFWGENAPCKCKIDYVVFLVCSGCDMTVAIPTIQFSVRGNVVPEISSIGTEINSPCFSVAKHSLLILKNIQAINVSLIGSCRVFISRPISTHRNGPFWTKREVVFFCFFVFFSSWI